MQKHRYVDLSVGLFMLFSLGALIILAVKVSGVGVSNLHSKPMYTVTALFSNVGGLKVRAPVTVAGVKIGEVTSIVLQPRSLDAKVYMKLRQDKPIPYADTSARILTQGLLGSNYISLVPGFEEESNKDHQYLKNGDVIPHTQEAMILENLIGQLVFNINNKKP
ncbi:MAG: outer membrane lipid asymmetry maintenance protein MlaD [Legionellales bacterium RIFCSPHIGHO2_12_FULL_37_14]|nr:MAG: outer membrane lipid asymmetry maintenance protein MlaD [Legionellales bacterium RIFCSPHIGHO2_12_FULL_37_14]